VAGLQDASNQAEGKFEHGVDTPLTSKYHQEDILEILAFLRSRLSPKQLAEVVAEGDRYGFDEGKVKSHRRFKLWMKSLEARCPGCGEELVIDGEDLRSGRLTCPACQATSDIDYYSTISDWRAPSMWLPVGVLLLSAVAKIGGGAISSARGSTGIGHTLESFYRSMERLNEAAMIEGTSHIVSVALISFSLVLFVQRFLKKRRVLETFERIGRAAAKIS